MARRRRGGRPPAASKPPATGLPESELPPDEPLEELLSRYFGGPRALVSSHDTFVETPRETLERMGVYRRSAPRRYVVTPTEPPRRDPIKEQNARISSVPRESYEDCLRRTRQNQRRKAILVQSGHGGRNGAKQYRAHRDPCK